MEIISSGSVGILIFVIVLVLVLSTIARYRRNVSPNVVAVVSGRKYKITDDSGNTTTRGYRIISGGGFFLVPVFEKMQEMSLNVRTINVTVHNVPDVNGALVTVVAVANVKILSSVESLPLSIERFLGKPENEIDSMSQQTLEGNLRAIAGTMTIEELIKDRAKFQQHVLTEAGTDLAKLGLGVDVLKIKDISDERGYIESLGKKQTAQVVRDAAIGEAEMQRDTAVQTAAAKQQGEIATAKANQAISDANRDLGMQVADNTAKVEAQQARVPLVAKQAAAEEQAKVNKAEIDAEKAKVTAEIDLQVEAKKKQVAELDATVIVAAEKAKEALLIEAEARQLAAAKDGEALRIKQEKEGEGEKAKLTAVAEGRKAAATADQAELEAKANGEKAGLLATAAGTQAQLEAEAAGTKAKLLAEAEGILKKAEAFKQLDEAGRFLMIIEALPPVIAALGDAGSKILTPFGDAIGQGLGNVDEIRIIDMGGNSGQAGNGKNVLGQFVNLPVETLFGLKQKLEASGMMGMASSVLSRFGFDIEKELFSKLPAKIEGQATEVIPTTPAVAAEIPPPTKAVELAVASSEAPAGKGNEEEK